jgi:hypothetical protein
MEDVLGYHSEWNLGSPGGWDYQRMTQELGRKCWEKIQSRSGLTIQLDFDHPLLNPMHGFTSMLLRAHERLFGRQSPFILLVAEEETLDKVIENQNLVKTLNRMDGVESALAAPHQVDLSHGQVTFRGKQVTGIFLDFNTDTLMRLNEKHDLSPLVEAVKQGILVNPRGMEAVNAKGIFEVATGPCRNLLSSTTVDRTPWTRRFYQRATTGPAGTRIHDLVEWTRDRQHELVLKPEHGYSGYGVYVGPLKENWDAAIETALKQGDYIVQSFIPLGLWAEEQPWVDHEAKELIIKQWQTDFRCLITDQGLIGFVGRFGGVPTNVGSGGGVQPIALLKSPLSVKEATNQINDAVCNLGYEFGQELRGEMDREAVELGLTYLLGPIMTALRPRLITQGQLHTLHQYSSNLWSDCITLERVWREGNLREYFPIQPEIEEIFRLQPWEGSPALMASDGLFSFGAHIS